MLSLYKADIVGKISEAILNRFLLLAFLGLTGLLHLLFFQQNPIASSDSLVFRGILFLLALALFFASLRRKEKEEHFHLLFILLSFVVGFYSLFLILKNDFALLYLLEYMVLSTIISLSFSNKKEIIFFLIVSFAVYITGCFFYVQSISLFLIHFVLLSFFCGFLLIFFFLKKALLHQLNVREVLLHKVFYGSPDALFLVEATSGKIKNRSALSRQFFPEVEENASIDKLFLKAVSTDLPAKIKTVAQRYLKFEEEEEFYIQKGKKIAVNIAVHPIALSTTTFWLIRISDISKNLRDKRNLEEGRRLLLEVINLLPHQIYVKDSEGKFLLINKAVATMYGKEEKEIIGHTDFELMVKKEVHKLNQLEQEVIKKNKTIVLKEEKFQASNGAINYFHSTKIPFLLEDNSSGLLGVDLDITEAQEAEKKIKKSEAKYKMLMEQASDGIIISNANGLIIEANEKASEIFGYALDEFKALNAKELLGYDADNKKQEWGLKESVIVEKKFVRKDGIGISIEISAKVLPDGRRQAIIRDSTERKRLEKTLKASERKLSILIENSSDIIFILGADFKISFVSTPSERILGFPQTVFLGKEVSDFVHDEEKELFLQQLKETVTKPEVNVNMGEVRWKSEQSEKFRYLEIVAVNLLEDAVIQGIVLNCHDITKRIKIEKELTNTNFELDSFVYKASHDLKAPLRSIMGLIKLATLENKDPSQEKYLDLMNKSVNSLDAFIKELTLFSRNSRLEVEPQQVDFEQIITASLESLKFLENAHKVEIRKKITIESIFYSDITRINTIINNLLSNAFKYHRFDMNNPYINIEIATTPKGAVIHIEDNGQGIEKAYLSKIFDMFYRASENSYGSGLGLYIVKNAINRLQGEVFVQSFPEKGSIFTVKLPNLINDFQ